MSKKLLAARSNWAFFVTAVVSELFRDACQKLILEAQQEPKSFAFSHEGYDGYMIVDARELSGTEVFQSDLRSAVNRVAEKIPRIVKGDMSDHAAVDEGKFRFTLRISGYWLGTPYDPPVEDPTLLPLAARMGRTVNLEVGYAV